MQNNSGVSRQRSFRRTFAVSPTCWDFGPRQRVLEADDSESKKHNLNKSRPGQHRRERNRYIPRAEEQTSDVNAMQNQLTSPHQNRSSNSPRCIRRSGCDSRNVVWNMAFLLHGYLHVQHENDKSRSFLLIVSVEQYVILRLCFICFSAWSCLFVCVCVCVCVCSSTHYVVYSV